MRERGRGEGSAPSDFSQRDSPAGSSRVRATETAAHRTSPAHRLTSARTQPSIADLESDRSPSFVRRLPCKHSLAHTHTTVRHSRGDRRNARPAPAPTAATSADRLHQRPAASSRVHLAEQRSLEPAVGQLLRREQPARDHREKVGVRRPVRRTAVRRRSVRQLALADLALDGGSGQRPPTPVTFAGRLRWSPAASAGSPGS